MVNIAICDDEKAVLRDIKKMVTAYMGSRNIENRIFLFLSGKELLNSKMDEEIDILFLDIRMEQPDGMETARRMRRNGYKGFLVFITVLKEMVFRSFEVQASGYLLKPLVYKNFADTMGRLMSMPGNAAARSLLIQRGTESSIIRFDGIVFCEVIDRKIYLHLNTGSVIDYYDRIGNLLTKLDGRFFQCHRSYLVNMQYLTCYKNNTAYLADKYEIPVSRLRSKDFSAAVLEYMKGKGALYGWMD